jgi:hypothetical protein
LNAVPSKEGKNLVKIRTKCPGLSPFNRARSQAVLSKAKGSFALRKLDAMFGNILAANRFTIWCCHFLIRNASVSFGSVQGSTRDSIFLLGAILVFKTCALTALPSLRIEQRQQCPWQHGLANDLGLTRFILPSLC